ncbi:hypothetical protein AB0E96_33605 [Kitasatospora sp. NPDC036755]|uniref:hypothetical protein n=1 Tax=Kitasatospora sp. NPDC036755 TaxID=3154600 RepID=UPI0033DCC9AC
MTGLLGSGGSYRAWADFLERWARGAPEAAEGLPPLVLEDFPEDTRERFRVRVTEALTRRLQDWSDALTAALNAAPDEFGAGRALAQARTGLRAVRALAEHPGLDEEFRTRLTEVVDERIRRFQTDQEGELDRLAALDVDPGWLEERRRTLRDNPLTAVIAETAPASRDGWSYDPAAPPRRRIVRG